MKLLQQFIFAALLCLNAAPLAAQETSSTAVLEAANENKTLFIFFYKDQSEKTVKLQQIFEEATSKQGGQIKSIKVNKNDPAEKAIIDRFNLSRCPMPFVLVIAPNGAITGGFPSFTQEELVRAIASPGAASCIKALQEHKLVLLCLQNNQTTSNQEALKGVQEFKADPRFANATEIVIIDPANKQEKQFLSQLNLPENPSQATTVIIAPPAEVIAAYQGPISAAQLASDIQKASKGCCGHGCCCPGGKCGPNQ